DASYLARLRATDQTTLSFPTALAWADPSGDAYGPTALTGHATEVISIVTFTVSGPTSASPGSVVTSNVTLSNEGHASATVLTLDLALPEGTTTSALS